MSIESLNITIQSVIPTVFDDELSHTESLGKVVDKMNEVVDLVNNNYNESLMPGALVDFEDEDFSTSGSGTMLNGRLDKWEERITEAEDAIEGGVNPYHTHDQYLAKATNVTLINDQGIADGEIAVFNLTSKDIRTSNAKIAQTVIDSPDSIPSGAAFTDYMDTNALNIAVLLATKVSVTTNIKTLNDSGIADGEIAVFNKTAKDIRTSNVTIVTTLGADDTTIPTSGAIADEGFLKAVEDANATTGAGDLSFYTCTAAEYAAIVSKDASTIYFVI